MNEHLAHHRGLLGVVKNPGSNLIVNAVDVQCAIKIERWMVEHGHTDWALMGIASRSAYERVVNEMRDLKIATMKVTTQATLDHMRRTT